MGLFISLMLAAIGCATLSASIVLASYGANESPLATLFIEGARGTLFETSIFLFVCATLFLAYALSASFRRTVRAVFGKTDHLYQSLPPNTRLILLFSCALGLLFSLNAAGIVYGYFHSDDFSMTARVAMHSWGELIWMPYSQHAMPLNWVETSLFYHIFGTNPLPYNLFLLLIIASLPFAGFLFLRELGYGRTSFCILFSLFGTSVIASEFLAGFYALAIYPQVLLFFLIALWTYVRSYTSAKYRRLLLFISLLFIFAATFFDISGIWTSGAYVLFAYTHWVARGGQWSPATFIRGNTIATTGAFLIFITYGLYLVQLATIQPEQFLGSGQPLSLGLFKQMYDVYTAGTIAQLFLPSAGLIVSQPRFLPFLSLWTILMVFLFVCFAILFYTFVRHANPKTRAYGIFVLLLMLGTGLLTALGRPTTHPAAFFPVQQIIMPFFWLCVLLTIMACEYVHTGIGEERTKRIMAVLLSIILIVSAQHVFAFYKNQNVQEVLDSKHNVERLQNLLVPALNELAAQTNDVVFVPDVRGSYINPFLFGKDASQYRAFLNLSDNIAFTDVRHGPYAASTSHYFTEALQTDDRLRSIYLANAEIEVGYGTERIQGTQIQFISDGTRTIVLQPRTVDPLKQYWLAIDVSVPVEHEKTYLQIGFGNPISKDAMVTIRLDQYSKPLPGVTKRYTILIDLNQSYAFALSPRVTDVTITFATPGGYTVHGYRFAEVL